MCQGSQGSGYNSGLGLVPLKAAGTGPEGFYFCEREDFTVFHRSVYYCVY